MGAISMASRSYPQSVNIRDKGLLYGFFQNSQIDNLLKVRNFSEVYIFLKTYFLRNVTWQYSVQNIRTLLSEIYRKSQPSVGERLRNILPNGPENLFRHINFMRRIRALEVYFITTKYTTFSGQDILNQFIEVEELNPDK